LILGLTLGVEREFGGNPAGLRTMGLVTAGACLFAGLGLIPFEGRSVDPTRIAAQIVTGVGFLGAGSILRQGESVHGLTTAASIWIAAAIGMAVGFSYYVTAIISTAVVLITVVGLGRLENRFIRARRNRRRDDPNTEPITP
jgi:putative Mg2+ transporter-C (MgtC) family protein